MGVEKEATDRDPLVLILIKTWLFLWDLLTWPVYQLVQRPWEARQKMNVIRSHPIRRSDTEVVYEASEVQNDLYDDIVRSRCDTMDKTWKWVVRQRGHREVFGTRDVLAEEDEVQSNGKIFKKLHLGDYRWITYSEADATIDYLSKGLRMLGMRPGEKICIFADTRCEWFLSAQACFKQNFPLVTLYTNLGEEAVMHGLNQTKVTHVITSHDLLPKFKHILPQTPNVTTVMYFVDQLKATPTSGFPENVDIVSFWDVVSLGQKNSDAPEVQPIPPRPSDTGIIMYTSGSTGVPKGVVQSHKNLVATLKSVVLSFDMKFQDGDTFIAFLPLAHVLELLGEMTMVLYGVRIGYSTPNTLNDNSSMVKKGASGDASVLRPTIMSSVPLILDRVYKASHEAVRKRGEKFEKIFQFCYEYRLAAIRRGEKTPILDFFVFRPIRNMLGGRLRLIITGGAPLSKETNDFIRTIMGSPVIQGYGLTETCACVSMTSVHEVTTECVGPPNQGMQVKLVNWEEGGYRVTDKPRPRGEIVAGGNAVTEGYYEMPEKTAEDFYESHGRRWFRTGDIGQIEPDGTIKIIDRKKDLVKLQFGEYVSLGKVEAVLKTCPIVENVCVYGIATQSYMVALVCPDRKVLAQLAEKLGKGELTAEQACLDRDVTGAVLRQLVNHGKAHRLEKFELPGAVTLCQELWLPETGLVTAAFKLKRRQIQDRYQADLDRMYGVSIRSV